MKLFNNVLVYMGIIAALCITTGCSKGQNSENGETESDRFITSAVLGSDYSLNTVDTITIKGIGFQAGDGIKFKPKDSDDQGLNASVLTFTSTAITFTIPTNLTSGYWNIYCLRDSKEQLLGWAKFTINTLPAGTTVFGKVTCQGTGLEGIYVSDGVKIVRTDITGTYSIASARKHGYVFLIIPSGYEVPVENSLPGFWQTLKDGTKEYNFTLNKVDNSNYVMIVAADVQVGNSTPGTITPRIRTSVICSSGFLTDIDSLIDTYSGKKIYSLSLGDMTHDTWWYESATMWAIPQYKNMVKDFGCPIFHVMGNHDNDPYLTGDFNAESTYKKELGPTFYSFNIGSTHYLVLDNVQYINTGGAQGIEGSMDYTCGVTSEQLNWAKADLATVTDKTAPLVVALHAPLTESAYLSPVRNSEVTNSDEIAALFDQFSNVTILSGHAHTNHNSAYPGRSNILEHNCGAVCGALWYNVKGYNGTESFGACRDGAPMGYTVYEVSGRNVSWYYKGSRLTKERQFNAYDMNKIDSKYKDKVVTNEILVNVWNWDSQWSVKVYENGNSINVTQQVRKDPDYTKFAVDVYTPTGATGSSGTTASSMHFFSAVTSSSTSSVRVDVTDRFGKVYSKQIR